MKFQLFRNGDGSYETIIHNETKMLPDPAYVRTNEWGGVDPIVKKGPEPVQLPGEGDPEFAARHLVWENFVEETDSEYSLRVTAREAQIETEAVALYQAEFNKAAPVKVVEKDIA